MQGKHSSFLFWGLIRACIAGLLHATASHLHTSCTRFCDGAMLCRVFASTLQRLWEDVVAAAHIVAAAEHGSSSTTTAARAPPAHIATPGEPPITAQDRLSAEEPMPAHAKVCNKSSAYSQLWCLMALLGEPMHPSQEGSTTTPAQQQVEYRYRACAASLHLLMHVPSERFLKISGWE